MACLLSESRSLKDENKENVSVSVCPGGTGCKEESVWVEHHQPQHLAGATGRTAAASLTWGWEWLPPKAVPGPCKSLRLHQLSVVLGCSSWCLLLRPMLRPSSFWYTRYHCRQSSFGCLRANSPRLLPSCTPSPCGEGWLYHILRETLHGAGPCAQLPRTAQGAFPGPAAGFSSPFKDASPFLIFSCRLPAPFCPFPVYFLD